MNQRAITLSLLAAIASGVFVALQQRINGGLSSSLGDPLVAALVSFSSGLGAVSAVVLARPSARSAVRLVRDVPWVQRLGGLGGAVLVVIGAAAAPEIGVALLSVGLVAGQTAGGLLVDRVGLGPGGPRPLTAPRLLGAGLCLVAVVLSGLGEGARSASPLLLLLVVAAGLLIALQQALNGQVRRTTGDAGVATLVNFAVGAGSVGLGLLIHIGLSGFHVAAWPGPGQWYLYLGGPVGAAFVAVAAVTVKTLGVLRLGLAITAGQLVGALVLDLVVPVSAAAVGVLTVVGVALTLVAVVLSGRRA